MAKNKSSPKSKSTLEALRSDLRTRFGEDIVAVSKEVKPIPRISTGIIALDKGLGGGLAMGRFTELFGNPSSGKTTIVLSTMIQAQKKFPDKEVLYVDAEHALDLEWAAKLGMDMDRFNYAKPETAEQGFLLIEEFLKTGELSVIALDSVPASVPRAALEGDIGEANIGLQARIIAQCLPRIVTRMSQLVEPPVLILINQKRANLQSRNGFQGFEPSKATGGKALPFYMATRLDVARIGTVKDSLDDEIGQQVLVHAVKHKINPGPGARITFRIDNRIGIDTPQELLDIAIADGSITKSGSWFVMPDGTKVQGEGKAKEWITAHGSNNK